MADRRMSGRGPVSPEPEARKGTYITPDGYERLRAEIENLWKVERPKVTQAVSIAAALGDRSENADYIYGKKRLREIDSRLRFLRKRLDVVTVVRERPDCDDRVFFGAWVTLEDEEGERVCYRIVGPDESDAKSGAISMDSPVGRRLLGCELDDEVEVARPRGEKAYTIIGIAYRDPAGGDESV